jgi:hypothetical protein
MKKLIFILSLYLFGAGLFGQGIGIFYTKNGAKLTGDKPQGFKIAYDQGFAMGAFWDIKLAQDVELSLQPGYQKIQSKIQIPDGGNPGEYKDTLDFSLSYFTLPILFKIHPINSKRFYFIGGPQLGFLLDSTTTNENGEEKDQSAIMNDFNFSLNFGFAYKIPIKSTYLFIEARYEQGLINVTDFGNSDELLSRVKTQGINLSLGFGLPFKQKSSE